MVSSDDLDTRIGQLSPTQRALLDEVLASRAGEVERRGWTPVERTLASVWQEVLPVAEVDLRDSFLALGGDSISSLQVTVKLLAEGLHVTPRQVIEAESLAELALLATAAPGAEQVGREVATGHSTLTPIQHWFFGQNLPDLDQWNQALFVDVHVELDESVIDRALCALTTHHDALRSTFAQERATWTQEVPPSATRPAFQVCHLEDVDLHEQDQRMRRTITEAQHAIDVTRGPLVSAVLFRLGALRDDRLLVAVHHLVVDGVSLRVLLEDLDSSCRQLAADATDVVLPAKSTPWVTWSHALARYARSRTVHAGLDHWRTTTRRGSAVAALGGNPETRSQDVIGDSAVVTIAVPPSTVDHLRRGTAHRAKHGVRDTLLAGLLLAWRESTGEDALHVDVEGHGREPLDEPVDVSRTVGWFTSIYPVALALSEGGNSTTALDAVRQQMADVPLNGIGYGLLRHLDEEAGRILAELPPAEVSFNYLGWFDRPAGPGSLFGAPLPVPSPLQSPATPRPYALEVVVTGVADRLTAEFLYGQDVLPRRAVEEFANAFVGFVVDIVDRQAADVRDFPLMTVSRRTMSEIARQVGVNRQEAP
jgi:non-ribosomal peptide synthase protein (TIGR01720 family)